jgi:hypothetical protein
LSTQTKTQASLKTAAQFSPLWKPFELVAPSPKWIECTSFLPRSLAACAAPTPCGICVPITLDQLG